MAKTDSRLKRRFFASEINAADMSAFGIFAIVLTVIYVVYYGVMLAYDQYGVKGQKKNDVEEFESPDQGHEVSRRVHENSDGTFSVTDEQPEEEEQSPASDDL